MLPCCCCSRRLRGSRPPLRPLHGGHLWQQAQLRAAVLLLLLRMGQMGPRRDPWVEPSLHGLLLLRLGLRVGLRVLLRLL